MVDLIVESQLVFPEGPLDRVLVVHEVDGDIKAQMIAYLNLALLEAHKWRVEPLERELDPPPTK